MMIKSYCVHIVLLVIVASSMFFIGPISAFVDLGHEKKLNNYSQSIINTDGSPYDISVQYQIRDKADN